MLKEWIRKWLRIDRDTADIRALEQRQRALASRIDDRIKELDELTRIDVDVGMRDQSMVVLTGVYRGKGYVKFYDMPADEFRHFVEMFRNMERSHLIRNVDAPYPVAGGFEL